MRRWGLRQLVARTSASLAVTLAALLTAAPARAQDSQGVAAAEALFQQGRELMAAGKYAEACPKLQESLRLDPGIGTTLYLAECYEKNGQTASAWARFKEAADQAKAAGQGEREKKARDRAQRLEPQLVKMTISLSPGASAVPNLEVRRDGMAVGSALMGTPLPVDPGKRQLTASAPGHKTWSTQVDVPPTPGAPVVVTIPALQPEAAKPEGPAPIKTNDADLAPRGNTQRIAGLVVGGAGVLGIGIGTVFGLIAKSKNDEALEPQNCPDATHCYARGIELTEDAKTAGTVSTVAFVAGGVALAGGVVLFLTAPRAGADPARTVGVSASLSPGGSRLALRASF